MNTAPRASGAKIVLVLATLTAFGAVATDMYLPAFNSIQSGLATHEGMLQLTLSLFLIGLAAGQAVLGPIVDSFGRKPALLAGVGLFVAASAMAALAPNIEILLLSRLLQGLGGAAGQAIPRSMVRDLYDSQQSVKVFSLLFQILALAPIIAPFLGSLLLGLGWQAIFWALAVFGLITFVASARLLPETLAVEARAPFTLGEAFRSYGRLLRTGRYLGMTLAAAFSMASLFAYISASPFIFMGYYGLSSTLYSTLFAVNAVGMMGCGQAAMFMAGRMRPERQLFFGFVIHLVCVLAFFLCVCLGLLSPYVVIALLFLCISTLPLIFGSIVAAVMASVPRELTGSGSALMGVMQYVLGGLAGAALGVAHTGTLLPFAAILLFCSAAAFVSWLVAGHLSEVAIPAPARQADASGI